VGQRQRRRTSPGGATEDCHESTVVASFPPPLPGLWDCGATRIPRVSSRPAGTSPVATFPRPFGAGISSRLNHFSISCSATPCEWRATRRRAAHKGRRYTRCTISKTALNRHGLSFLQRNSSCKSPLQEQEQCCSGQNHAPGDKSPGYCQMSLRDMARGGAGRRGTWISACLEARKILLG
jgi:hypothetical protein